MTDIDSKIEEILHKMLARLPAGKCITADVAVQVLKGKYQSDFAGVDFASKKELIQSILTKGAAAPKSDAPKAPVVAPPAKPPQDDADEDEDDDSSDDESFDEEAESGSGEESSSEDEEEENFDDSDDDEEDEEGGGEDSGEPKLKKPRVEGDAAADDEQRCELMKYCLGKLGYRVRKQNDGESAADYIKDVLVPYFIAKKLDPERYTAEDVKRYKILKELHDLQADGGNVELSRHQRRGRYVAPPQESTFTARPMFLDDE